MTTKRVDPKEAQALLEQGWTYIDVRTENEFDGGHPRGSINIPMNSPDFLAVMKAHFKPDAKLVVGCLMGGRSARACMVLESQGFSRSWVRTDYVFADEETAARVCGAFFGAPLVERIREHRWSRVPECTAVFQAERR